eukprot:TRINITY_DN4115_c0_g1_i1.p1 TRINITY_DN4115_c0_g1~~TRINITY_DN4115_c0_g1_i1.p1  ORF type:complete len:495 (-),score=79.74 TRINITY_DN4115_c0_g1_i1:373-1857(-)
MYTGSVGSPLSPSSRKRRSLKIISRYELGKTIGEGEFAKVKIATRRETGERVAVKIIEKDRITSVEREQQLQREFSLMKAVIHQHIVKLQEVLSTPTRYYIVLELCSGGELFDKILSSGCLDETQARKYFQQLISGVDYMHRHKICHRDLKPENLLLDDEGNLKISDFGFSTTLMAERLYTAVGTPNYVAPEILTSISNRSGYDGTKVDVWSCGVILYIMLTGCFPFDADSHADLFDMICNRDVYFPSAFPKGAQTLVRGMLMKDPSLRMTTGQIKSDQWFNIDRPVSPSPPMVRSDLVGSAMKESDEVREIPIQTPPPLPPRPWAQETTPVTSAPQPQQHQQQQLSAATAAFIAGPPEPVSGRAQAFLAPKHVGPRVLKRILDLYYNMSDRISKSTAFLSLASPMEIMERLSNAFQSLGSTPVIPYMYKVKATFRPGHKEEVSIHVEIIEMAPGVHLVEFARRKGPPIKFFSIYNHVRELCGDIVKDVSAVDQ